MEVHVGKRESTRSVLALSRMPIQSPKRRMRLWSFWWCSIAVTNCTVCSSARETSPNFFSRNLHKKCKRGRRSQSRMRESFKGAAFPSSSSSSKKERRSLVSERERERARARARRCVCAPEGKRDAGEGSIMIVRTGRERRRAWCAERGARRLPPTTGRDLCFVLDS